jgi:pimeloyl-ACP methyl ester carboxylesterase
MSGVLINGSLIHYETFGRGNPIVFVHGWLGSWRYWVPVMDQLSSDFRTYALDLWGFGDSDKGQEQYDVDTYVELLVAFMDELGIWRSPLVGHTLGAAIAAKTAAQHPDRVNKVMAVGLPLTADAINHKLLTAGPNDLLARLFWHRQRPYAEVEMSVPKIAKNALALTIQSVARLDLRQTLDEIDAPVLTVYGAKDSVVSPDQAQELDAEGNHYAARAIVLPGSSHFPMLDETAKFTRLLRDFMDVENPEDLRELAIKKEWRRRTR